MFNKVDSPVSEALIFVCEKCGQKIEPKADVNPSRQLQLAMKEKIKSRGDKGRLRATITSCMDICPDEQIAVAILKPNGTPNFFTVEDYDDEVAEAILGLFKKKS